MTGITAGAPPKRQVSNRSRFAFGFGSIAYGIKDNGFATFLLLFYNQVIGLPASTVGIVIMCALVLEAFVDPAFGFLSDRTRGRWGRRHPWMYASVLPVAIGWLLLWNPPALEGNAMLAYLFCAALLVRIALSAFEIPSVALGAELTSDYDERTKLFSYRYLFGWAGGLTMLLLAYAVFLVPDADTPNGLLNAEGYSRFALVGAVAMAIAIFGSALGLHHEIDRLPKAAPAGGTARAHLAEFRETVSNRAFLILMAAGVFAYTMQGMSFALSNYMYQFVWRFEGSDFIYLALTLFAGAIAAFVITPRITKGGDKPRAGAILIVVNAVLITTPYWLRIAGVFPEPESPLMLPTLFALFFVNTACGVSAFILGASMMADVVEESEISTGRRSEGVFFAGSFFVQKLVGGLGIFMAGAILWFADFPAAAEPGQVARDSIDRLTIVFSCLALLFGLLSAYFYARFPFGRAEHEARLARLVPVEA